MAGRGALRWVRALLLASVMLAAGCSGHVAAGGVAPPVALLGPMLVVATMAAAPFLEAPASASRVVVLMLAGQGILHGSLDLLGGASTGERAPTTMTMPPSAGGSMQASSLEFVSGAHLGMLIAHVGAALVVVLWLAAGERALWRLVEVSALIVATTWGALRAACTVTPYLLVAVPTLTAPARVDLRPVRRSVWDGRSGPSRRGPPCGCAA